MNLNDFTQYFDNPAVSVFNRSQSKSFPMKIGSLYPAKWELLSFGNSQKSNSAHSMRLAPLVAPAFADMQFQDHSAIIPLRTIIKDYEETFNFAVNRDGASLPHLSADDYKNILLALTSSGISPIGSLFDFLGYPVFADLYKSLDWSKFNFSGNGNDNKVLFNAFDSLSYSQAMINDSYPTGSYSYRGSEYELLFYYPFVTWLALVTDGNFDPQKILLPEQLTSPVYTFYQSIPATNTEVAGVIDMNYVPSLDELVQASKFSTSKEAIEQYKLYLFGHSLSMYFLTVDFSTLNTSYSTLPIRAYHRFCYDWNLNGNFVDRDILLEENVFNFESTILQIAASVADNPTPVLLDRLKSLVVPQNRLWNDDFFTSLLPTSTVDNAVEIPANSTVLDLAKLTAWQKFVMRLSYSSRYRDVVWNLFKIKPSDARLVQSYPIFRNYENIGIGEINQTSSSDISGVLGSFAGRGYSSGRNKGYNIFCEEPCVLIDFVSIMPRAKYADAVHPLIHVDDILDFPLPDMDVLGNQPIYSDLASGNPLDHDTVLGYGRQYQEWLYNISTVHGDFKTTLDYWNLTRRFSDTPVINDDFLRIHPSDDLDIIFSLQDENHAFLDIYYNAKVTRHVHRNVRIKI